MTIRTAADLIAEAQKHVSCLDAQSAKDLYDRSEGAVILDVREADSVGESKLADSVHISRGLLEMKAPKQFPDSRTPILVHCGGGGRASLAAFTLRQMGYEEVHAITARYGDLKTLFG